MAAAHSPPLAAGMLLIEVQGVPCGGKPYEIVLGMIKSAGRPLTLAFEASASDAPPPPPAPAKVKPVPRALQASFRPRPVQAQELAASPFSEKMRQVWGSSSAQRPRLMAAAGR